MKMLLLFFAALLFSHAVSKKIIPVLRIEKFENCPDKPPGYYNDKSELINITISKISRNDHVINGIVMVRNVATHPKIKVRLSRCSSRLMSTCEHFMAIKLDFCDMLSKNIDLIAKAVKNIYPKPDCPFRNGPYKLNNMTFEANAVIGFFKQIPDMDKFFWIVRASFLNSKEKENLCLNFMQKIDFIRTRN